MQPGKPPPPSRFAIWFNQRSGSSYLRELLNDHPDIFCAPELFYRVEKFGGPDAFERSGCASSDEFLELLYTPRSLADFWERIGHPQASTERAIGLKVKYEQAITYPLIQGLQRAGARMVHLTRNPLAVHASIASLQAVKELAGDVNFAGGTTRSGPLTVRLDPHLAVWEVFRIHQAQQFGHFVCRSFITLDLRYEDLVARPEESLRQVLGFLGVPWFELTTQLTKALPPTLEETIENYGEIHDALKRTELAHLVF